jgi:NhaA family Na+:H+ antiporter
VSPTELPNKNSLERLLLPMKAKSSDALTGAALLLVATVAAMVWANSGFRETYQHVLHAPVSLSIGPFVLEKSAGHWISDGLMGVFFFWVGLDIKREVLTGELSRARAAMLPIAAAVGGMLVPAALFAVMNLDAPGMRGWGIPMATDIAFALGALALLGDRVPKGLKAFLVGLAIVDDIGGIIVIAFFYTESVSFWLLLVAGGLLVVSAAANALRIRHPVFYLAVGLGVWLCFLQSGVHATLAAVLMAFTIPARTRIDRVRFHARMHDLLARYRDEGLERRKDLYDPAQEHIFEEMRTVMDRAGAPLQRLESLHAPIVVALVLPLFALANAGIALEADSIVDQLTHPVAIGIMLGLIVGKQVGIVGGAWLATRLGLAELPPRVSWRQVHGASALAGIGFTMALFISDLAFKGDPLGDTAKVGILAASVLSASLGLALLWRSTREVAPAIAAGMEETI